MRMLHAHAQRSRATIFDRSIASSIARAIMIASAR
jgi:hypothetical protein